MERPAKRLRLSEDTCDDVAQSTEVSQLCHTSSEPSNSFQGTGIQNPGNFRVGGDVNISINKQPDTSERVDKRKVLLDSLRFDQMDSRQSSIKKAHGRTCAWFLKTPAYTNWLQKSASDNGNKFLWIKGKPGAGKSTLMNFLLGQLRNQTRRSTNQQEILLSFFFNAGGKGLEKETTGLYRSLLLQLLEARPDLQYVLENLRIGHNWTLESLKYVFEEAINGLGDTSLTCLIDALDECSELQIRDMVDFLSDLSLGRSRFRICFASRYYPHITINTVLDIFLEAQDGHKEDIASYINNKLTIKDSAIAEQIRGDLQEKASGVFMWVVLVVSILNGEYDAGCEHSLRKRIHDIPRDLHELFFSILTRDDKNRDGLLLCIQWVLFAQQPLTPRQLYFALFSGLEPAELERRHSDNISEDTIKRYILSNSKGLAESTISENPTVQFIHESVRDFLLKNHGLSKIWSDLTDPSTTFVGQNDMLKQCCLAYTNMEAAANFNESSREVITQQFPFLEYANGGLLYHADQAQTHDVGQKDFLTAFPLSKWVMHYNIFQPYKTRRYTHEVSLLYVLAEANTPALIRAHPYHQSCFKVENERYGLPILAASAVKSGAAIQTMLELEAERLSKPSVTSLISRLTSNPEALYASRRAFTFKKESDLFHQLLGFGNENISLVFLEMELCDINARGPDGRTILTSAIKRGFNVLVKALIGKGADTSTIDNDGQTPLSIAILYGDCEIAKLLLDHGANLDTASQMDTTLSYAPYYLGHLEMVKLLLDHGANPSATNSLGNTPLYLACSKGHLEIVKLLLDHGANPSATNSLGNTPLYLACSKGHLEIVKLLLDHGANPSATNSLGNTPLYLACSSGNFEIAKLLLDHGASPSDTNGYDTKQTPLDVAFSERYMEIIRLLLTYGADGSATISIKGQTLLYSAFVQGDIEMARALIAYGVDALDTFKNSGQALLYAALSEGHIEKARILIEYGADVSTIIKEPGQILLHIASGYELAPISVTFELEPILRVISSRGRAEIARLLISHGADVLATDRFGQTALHTASASDVDIDIAKLLIDNGANVQATDHDGKTPLHVAFYYRRLKVAKLLVECGAKAEDDILSWVQGRL